MPPVETKTQLLDTLRASRAALEKVVGKVSSEEMLKPGICGAWSAKDVLAHVAHWQELHLGWWAVVQRGETPDVPAPGYTWKAGDVDRLNHHIYLVHKDEPLEQVLAYLRETFARFLAAVEATPEGDLFRAGVAPFTGKKTLVRWYIEYAHHDGFGRNQIYQALVRKKRGVSAPARA